MFRPCKRSRRDNPSGRVKFQVTPKSAQNYNIVYFSQWFRVQEIRCTRMESFNFFRGMLDETTAGLLLDLDTKSLGESDRDPNDEIPVPSPTATTATRQELQYQQILVWLIVINRTTIPRIWFCCELVCVLTVL